MNLDDKRVGKMAVESAQMLSCALVLNAKDSDLHIEKTTVLKKGVEKQKNIYYYRGQRVYSPAYHNHPATIWARENQGNYSWLLLHFLHLCEEFEVRRGKKHASEDLRDVLCAGYDIIPSGDQEDFVNCANNSSIPGCDFRHVTPVTEAYKLYLNSRYLGDKRAVLFTNREKPTWVSVM